MTIQIGSDAVKALVCELLNEDTGSNPLDNGDPHSRHWQINRTKSLEDFEREPETILRIRRWDDGSWSVYPVISLYHKLTKILGLDDLCNEFNALPVNNWDSDEYYGVSIEGEERLEEHGFEPLGDTFNSEWGESCLSQAIQGETFELNGNYYALLQIHGGADVSEGYTNAKLFRLDDEYQLYQEKCSYELGKGQARIIYRDGEWFNSEGDEIDDKELSELVKQTNTSKSYIEGKILTGGDK